MRMGRRYRGKGRGEEWEIGGEKKKRYPERGQAWNKVRGQL